VSTVEADDACPDCCFIEDTAVVIGSRAVATCPGAPSRRGEVPAVAAELGRWCDIETMAAPATLDGGDVMRAGSTLFVGLSTRTNEAGVAMLVRAAAREGVRVSPMRVRGGLHLKSACTLAGPELVVYDAAVIGEPELAAFRAAGLEVVPAPEPAGANVLAIGGTVLVSAAAPRTAEVLAARGVRLRVVDVGEMHKGDGALTCLSIRVPRSGAWCT
jgi:dimethylargininase